MKRMQDIECVSLMITNNFESKNYSNYIDLKSITYIWRSEFRQHQIKENHESSVVVINYSFTLLYLFVGKLKNSQA